MSENLSQSSQHWINHVKQQSLSIISLIVAITALSYNTWRNEATESNRNIRESGFELLKASAELQLLIDSSYYVNARRSEVETQTLPIRGWTQVNFIVTLSQVMPSNVQRASLHLKSNWEKYWDKIHLEKVANESISASNKKLETEIVKVLFALN